MKKELQGEKYDRIIYPTEWRDSAAIVGMVQYFKFCNIEYELTQEYLKYHVKDVESEEAFRNYLGYVEKRYKDKMHHRVIEDILNSEKELSEEEVKIVNKRLTANTVCKKIFKEVSKYQPENRKRILELIEKERERMIFETYKNAIYKLYNNPGAFQSEKGEVSRVWNYYVDLPKKKKSMAFNWDYDTFVATDMMEYDFIPFAFTNTPISFFINCNMNLQDLVKYNEDLIRKLENMEGLYKHKYFYGIQSIIQSLAYDVEVICKEQPDNEYYETIILRKKAIAILKEIKDSEENSKGQKSVWSSLLYSYKTDSGDYVSIADVVAKRIIEQTFLDDLIVQCIKAQISKNTVEHIIKINLKIYKEVYMIKETFNELSYETKQALMAGQSVSEKLLVRQKANNKIISYKQKLIAALNFKDYERFCNILLQLSAYTEIPFEFAYKLFDDFEKNKNIAFAFVNALNKQSKEGEEK